MTSLSLWVLDSSSSSHLSLFLVPSLPSASLPLRESIVCSFNPLCFLGGWYELLRSRVPFPSLSLSLSRLLLLHVLFPSTLSSGFSSCFPATSSSSSSPAPPPPPPPSSSRRLPCDLVFVAGPLHRTPLRARRCGPCEGRRESSSVRAAPQRASDRERWCEHKFDEAGRSWLCLRVIESRPRAVRMLIE